MITANIWAYWSFSLPYPIFVLAGLQHQGIFRVSGSQLEVNDIKNSFERGTCYRFLIMSSLWLTSAVVTLPLSCLSSTNLILYVFSGNDPLTDDESNHDINSVAGVLKLYFRGLENPLFPKERFSDLLACISKSTFVIISYRDVNN